ncbi:MAG TPA: PilZ domain-containing protein [Myxococcales bacterium]
MREHLHFVDGTGYFFFPSALAPKGTLASLQVDFWLTEQVMTLRGWVWARSTGAGIWLELAGAERALRRIENAPKRSELRVASEQLVLVEADGLAALLCRLRDVSEGGARLAALPADAGEPGQRVRVALPEAGASGAQLEAYGRVAWADEGEVGLAWERDDPLSRAAVRRLLQHAKEEWEQASTSEHPRRCRCASARVEPRLVLLG